MYSLQYLSANWCTKFWIRTTWCGKTGKALYFILFYLFFVVKETIHERRCEDDLRSNRSTENWPRCTAKIGILFSVPSCCSVLLDFTLPTIRHLLDTSRLWNESFAWTDWTLCRVILHVFFNTRNETWIMPVTLTSHYGKDYQLLRRPERWYVTLRQNAQVIQYDYFIRSNFATRFKPVYLLPVETVLNDAAFNINPCTNDQFRKSAFNLHYRISSLALEVSSSKDVDPSHTFHMQDCTLSCPQKTA